ncbi:MAG: TIGR02996 domain-containing protein, partial [Gemmata sp.]
MSHAAFLQTICQAPDDDTARLVYADFLDEQGGPADAARAEFIRLQIRLAGLDETHPDRPALEDRENELLRAHERAWVGKLSGALGSGLGRWRFERGFVGAIDIHPGALAQSGGPFIKRHPIGRVCLGSANDDPNVFDALARREWWANVRDLDTGEHGSGSGLTAVEPLLASPHLTGLRRLAVTGAERYAARALATVLANCKSLHTLTALEVQNDGADPANLLPLIDRSAVRALRFADCRFTARGLKALFSSAFAARGGTLDLANGTLGTHLAAALAAKNSQPALRRVCLSEISGSSIDLPTLLSAPGAANLHALDVSETNLPLKGVRTIARSGFMARATDLVLTRCRVGPKGMALLAGTAAPHLRKLALGETGLGAEGVLALCDAPWA